MDIMECNATDLAAFVSTEQLKINRYCHTVEKATEPKFSSFAGGELRV